MKLKTLALDKIKPYERNPRRNDEAVAAVAESIRQCGYCAPIVVDEAGVILAGHTRYKAVKQLCWDKVQVVQKDDLSEEQKRKYRILDNKTGEIAEWDTELLEIELDGLDFEGFDFWLLGADTQAPEAAPEVTEDNFDEEPPEEPVTQRGQVWQLGRHRLMCGDAASTSDVQTLMGGGTCRHGIYRSSLRRRNRRQKQSPQRSVGGEKRAVQGQHRRRLPAGSRALRAA